MSSLCSVRNHGILALWLYKVQLLLPQRQSVLLSAAQQAMTPCFLLGHASSSLVLQCCCGKPLSCKHWICNRKSWLMLQSVLSLSVSLSTHDKLSVHFFTCSLGITELNTALYITTELFSIICHSLKHKNPRLSPTQLQVAPLPRTPSLEVNQIPERCLFLNLKPKMPTHICKSYLLPLLQLRESYYEILAGLELTM